MVTGTKKGTSTKMKKSPVVLGDVGDYFRLGSIFSRSFT